MNRQSFFKTLIAGPLAAFAAGFSFKKPEKPRTELCLGKGYSGMNYSEHEIQGYYRHHGFQIGKIV